MEDKILIKAALVALVGSLIENSEEVQQQAADIFTEAEWYGFIDSVFPPDEVKMVDEQLETDPTVTFDAIISLLTRLSEGDVNVPRTN